MKPKFKETGIFFSFDLNELCTNIALLMDEYKQVVLKFTSQTCLRILF